jgi:hypothetical protein
MSGAWQRTKTELNTTRDQIQNYINNDLPTDINLLKASLSNYIKKGGVSKNPANDADYNEINRLYTKINDTKAKYKKLNSDLSGKIREMSTAGDMGAILEQNGRLQSDISALQVRLKESEEDVKSAEQRDELLRSQDRNITKHQVFMLGRPLRPSSIPYLWALSILLIGVSLLIFQTQGPPLLLPIMEWLSMQSGASATFFDSRVWMVLSAALAIVIIFLSLRVANVI